MFFSSWVFKTTPSNLSVISSNSIAEQSLKEFNGSSSDFLLKNSILFGRHFLGGENSSQIEERESAVNNAESKDSLSTGNSNLTSFGKNVTVDDFNVSFNAKSTVNDSEDLSDVLATSDSVDSKRNDEGTHDGIDRDNHVVVKNFKKDDKTSDVSIEGHNSSIRNRVEQESKVDCDVTKGRWVFDESYPLYTNVTCPFIDEGFNCGGNGRLDKDYMKWRWQPQDCDVPRYFNRAFVSI